MAGMISLKLGTIPARVRRKVGRFGANTAYGFAHGRWGQCHGKEQRWGQRISRL